MIKKISPIAHYALVSLIVFNINCSDSYSWLPKTFSNATQSFWQWEHRNKAIVAVATTLASVTLWSLWKKGVCTMPSAIQKYFICNTQRRVDNTQQRVETKYTLLGKNFTLVQGDITKEGDILTNPPHGYTQVTAIVNAANSELEWGGGVCGAIFKASSNSNAMKQECNKIVEKNGRPLDVGQAEITESYYPKKSSITYVIHAVGPSILKNEKDPNLIKKAYLSSLYLAQKRNIQAIAFPLISSGFFGFTNFDDYYSNISPVKPALEAFEEFAQTNPNTNPKEIRLIIFDLTSYNKVKNAIETHHKNFLTQ